jgi:lysophospholipase
MALHEIEFASANGRDTVQGWLYRPPGTVRGIVQVVHGLGEHSRRYLHLTSTLLDAGFAVVADDHAGHGRTAVLQGTWADAGARADRVVVEDELTLQRHARDLLPDLPHVVFGHSWGSLIARGMATDPAARLDGLALGGIVAQMEGFESGIDRSALRALAEDERAAEPAPPEVVGQFFAGFLERFGEGAGPTAWVALDEDVVADHGRDPLNNFGAPLSSRFLQGFADLYDTVSGDAFYAALPRDLPVLIVAGDQDPVANYGEGAYHVANRLHRSGHTDVRTRVFPGVRHEVHNEPPTRVEFEGELVDFVSRVCG